MYEIELDKINELPFGTRVQIDYEDDEYSMDGVIIVGGIAFDNGRFVKFEDFKLEKDVNICLR